MKITEILTLDGLVGAIRQQSETKFGAGLTRQYVVWFDGTAVGLLIVEAPMNKDYLAVCKVFVPPENRKQGVGGALMVQAEQLAAALGRKRIRLRPEPFDGSKTEAQLTDWYSGRGYVRCAENAEELEKVL